MGAPGADPRERVTAAAELFKCLSAPLRIAVIKLLLERPRTVSELVEALAAPQPLISQHLRVLRDHCLVIGERSGRATTYSLMDAHVAHIVGDALAHTREHAHGVPQGHHLADRDGA